MIQNFVDFCRELNHCGFSMGGGNAKGIFVLIDYDWLNQDMLNPTAEAKTIRKFIKG